MEVDPLQRMLDEQRVVLPPVQGVGVEPSAADGGRHAVVGVLVEAVVVVVVLLRSASGWIAGAARAAAAETHGFSDFFQVC